MLQGSNYLPCAIILASRANVIVQSTCHGADNRAMVDALQHSDGTARGIATVRRDVSVRTAGDA